MLDNGQFIKNNNMEIRQRQTTIWDYTISLFLAVEKKKTASGYVRWGYWHIYMTEWRTNLAK